ncbi:hypothetical protein A5782_16480 [Mycobacterium sp. 852002-40037_SCH5390672]|nr:hypothetical protein A5782_16480 [Mycobacterium sp. 852002-40037_SCH5390672]
MAVVLTQLVAARATSAGDQQPTKEPPAGHVGMLTIGTQLTDVVETANASSSANKTFFPLVIVCRAYARPEIPRGAFRSNSGKTPSSREAMGNAWASPPKSRTF